MDKTLLQELAGITLKSAVNQKINKTQEVDIFPNVNENTGSDPIKQMADIWEQMLDDEGIDAGDADNFYDTTNNLLHALTEHLRDRGWIA